MIDAVWIHGHTSGDTGLIDYFLHIPKTAGTTFMAALDRQFYAERVCPAKLWRDLLRISSTELSRFRLFRGHFYNLLPPYLDRPVRTLTFLRDPIERALSHYAHVVREPGHYFHKHALKLGSLEAFIADPRTRPMISNFQTRSLALPFDIRVNAARFGDEQLEALALERQIETWMPRPADEEALLQTALTRLNGMAFVGLVERFDDSLLQLDRVSGWSLRETAGTRLNQSPQRIARAALDPATLAALEQANRLDLALYAAGVSRWAAQAQALDRTVG